MPNTSAPWLSLARCVARKRNLALWLDVFTPLMVGLSLAGAVIFLLLRQRGVPTDGPALGLVGLLIVVGLFAWLRTWGKFSNERDGLLQLDVRLRLHNRLTCARLGLGPWPDASFLPVSGQGDGLSWRPERVFVPPVACALLLAAALFIEIRPPATRPPLPTREPTAWTQAESWLDQLQKEELTKPEALEKLRQQIDKLRQQPEENWYSHGSLEAGDALRDRTKEGIEQMRDNLAQAKDALEQLAAAQAGQPGGASKETLQQVSDALRQAADGLQSGNMPMSQKGMGGLPQNLDPSGLAKMSAEQLKQMQQNLQNAMSQANNALGISEQDGLPGMKESNGVKRHGMSRFDPNGEGEGDGDGKGGTGKGPGHPPLQLGARPTDLKTKTTEKVENPDLSRAIPGETIGMSQGEHEIDKTNLATPQSAGSASSLGQGGDAIWTNSLSPEERDALQKYFE